MRTRQQTDFVFAQVICDGLAITVGLLVAYWFRFHSGLVPVRGGWVPGQYLAQYPWAVLLGTVGLYLTGNYHAHPSVISFNRARRILMGSALAIALLVVKHYFSREPDLSRVLYPIAFVGVTSSVVAGRLALQSILRHHYRSRRMPAANLLIVGLGPTALRLAARTRTRPEHGYRLVGFIDPSGRRVGRRIGGAPVLGGLADLRDTVRAHHVDDVFVAETQLTNDEVFRLFLDSEIETARLHVVPSLAEMMRSTIYYDEVAGVPVYKLRETPLSHGRMALKRTFDLAFALAGLVFLAPLFAVVAVLIRRSSPGPAIYRQQRLSLDGQPFTIYKFRTMPVESEKAGPVWGGRDDHRATPVGRFLRRWNIDELPQLWNVVRGDMSLVGPRPERPVYVDAFREALPRYMARHRVLTGMTGWAQVHGLRGDTSIPRRLRYDLYYIENWSMWLDIKILIMTFLRTRPRHAPRRRGGTLHQPATTPDQTRGTAPCPPAPTAPRPARSKGASRGSRAPAAESAAPSPSN